MADPVGVANCQLWVDASDASTVHHTAGNLDTWDDKSGNGRNFTTVGGGYTTEYPTTNTRTQNGLNVINFDGTDDFVPTASYTQVQPATIYVVCANDDGADSSGQTAVDQNSGTAFRAMSKTAGNVWSMTAGTALSGGTADTAAAYFTSVFNTTSSILRRNGTQLAAATAGSNDVTTGLRLGLDGNATQYWDGWIAEVLHYAGAHTSTEWNQVEAYLNNKWFVAAATYIRSAVIVAPSQAAQRASRW